MLLGGDPHPTLFHDRLEQPGWHLQRGGADDLIFRKLASVLCTIVLMMYARR